jgi:molecular chaperone HscB
LISNAYQVVKDDYKRADYILNLNGCGSIEDSTVTICEKEFLEQLMAIQEKIEETETKDELELIKDDVNNKVKELEIKLRQSFDFNQLKEAKEILKTLKFNYTILIHIDNKLSSKI